jgi:hypothetical protein
MWTPVGGAVLGVAAALVASRVRAPVPAARYLALAAVPLLGVAGAAASDGYVERHGGTDTVETRVSGWFADQPEWRDGDAPVVSTFALIGPLAGDRLQHPLELADAPDACRAAAAGSRDWIVLDVRENRARGVSGCGTPDYADDHYEAYAPAGAGSGAP